MRLRALMAGRAYHLSGNQPAPQVPEPGMQDVCQLVILMSTGVYGGSPEFFTSRRPTETMNRASGRGVLASSWTISGQAGRTSTGRPFRGSLPP